MPKTWRLMAGLVLRSAKSELLQLILQAELQAILIFGLLEVILLKQLQVYLLEHMFVYIPMQTVVRKQVQ